MSAVSVLLFGRVRELVGAEAIDLPAGPGETTATMLNALIALHPGLEPWRPHLRVAVNREYAPGERPVSPGDEIAVIPPVSGG
jgi:molybdopterin converting factor subunit 1